MSEHTDRLVALVREVTAVGNALVPEDTAALDLAAAIARGDGDAKALAQQAIAAESAERRAYRAQVRAQVGAVREACAALHLLALRGWP